MNRRFFLALPLLAAPGLARAQAFASLDQISAYLNTLTLAEGTFTQFNADGSRSAGRFLLQKPGKVRFEYTTPGPAVVVADGTMVAVIDPKAPDDTNVYELKRTPLSLLLRTDVDLEGKAFVRDHGGDGAGTRLLLVDPEDPGAGSMLLSFVHEPAFHLGGWTITDESGAETTVTIDAMTRGTRQPARLFDIPWTRANFGGG